MLNFLIDVFKHYIFTLFYVECIFALICKYFMQALRVFMHNMYGNCEYMYSAAKVQQKRRICEYYVLSRYSSTKM